VSEDREIELAQQMPIGVVEHRIEHQQARGVGDNYQFVFQEEK
jgi:hypothetical protein